MSRLKDYLKVCKIEYYAGHPVISDSQYDELELLYKDEMPIGSPGGRVMHLHKLYSLRKYYREDNNLPEEIFYIKTPKLDGAALALRYLHGILHSVVTRGDGEQGEDVTHLFKIIHPETRIPQKIKVTKDTSQNGFHQITGELVSPKSIKNARNYAAGALNLKDPGEFYFKNVEFFAYDLQGTAYNTYGATLGFLRDIGFNTPYTIDTSHLPTDGYVYRLDDNAEYKELGYTSKYPRGAFALKERSEGVKTILLNVVWETGKTGKVTPVAILDTIDIDGASVSRATLNNPGFIKALGIQIGDAVMVERAGGIIPRIIKKAE